METIDRSYLNELVLRTQKGSSNAFAELYAATYGRMYVYLTHMLKREEKADELLVRMYAAAAQRLASLSDPSLLMPYLARTAYQTAAEHRSGENAGQNAEHYRHIPIAESQILIMHDLQGMDETLIGDILNASEAEVRRYIKAGRRHLKQERTLIGETPAKKRMDPENQEDDDSGFLSRASAGKPGKRLRMRESMDGPDIGKAAALLERIFAESGKEDNTVPLEALASYAVYRKERFSWQKRLTGAAMAVFVLLPLLFLLPKVTVTSTERGERGLPVYTVRVRSILPVGKVTAHRRTHALPVYEAGAKEFTVEPTRNGEMTIRVELINRQAVQQTENVTAVDAEGPKLVKSDVGAETFTLYIKDAGIGVDYYETYARTSSGETVQPLSFDAEAGTVTFRFPEEPWDVYIPDHIGNTLHLALTFE